MAITQKFIFSKYKKVPEYTGSVFTLQPLPGGQPVDFYDLGDESWNSEPDGSGDDLEAWKSSVDDWFYFGMNEQNGSEFVARPNPGDRPKLSDDAANQQRLRVTLPGGLEFSFAVADSVYQDPYDDQEPPGVVQSPSIN